MPRGRAIANMRGVRLQIDRVLPTGRTCLDDNHDIYFIGPSSDGGRILLGGRACNGETDPLVTAGELRPRRAGRCAGTFGLWPHLGTQEGGTSHPWRPGLGDDVRRPPHGARLYRGERWTLQGCLRRCLTRGLFGNGGFRERVQRCVSLDLRLTGCGPSLRRPFP
jgi:hypothetical protein